jgi:hypothetical protein
VCSRAYLSALGFGDIGRITPQPQLELLPRLPRPASPLALLARSPPAPTRLLGGGFDVRHDYSRLLCFRRAMANRAEEIGRKEGDGQQQTKHTERGRGRRQQNMDNVSGRQRVRDEDVKGVELPPGACVCVCVCVSPALCLPLSVPRWKGKCRLSGYLIT